MTYAAAAVIIAALIFYIIKIEPVISRRLSENEQKETE